MALLHQHVDAAAVAHRVTRAGRRLSLHGLAIIGLLLPGAGAQAAEWHVAPGGTGRGTAAAPFGRIQDALRAARAGDAVLIAEGAYHETLRTVRGGTADAPIVLRAVPARSVLITAPGRVLTVQHPHVHVEGVILDGQYGLSDIVRVGSEADGFALRRSEVRRTSRDGIDLDAPRDVLIEDALIHRTLNAAAGRTDAHGIVAGAVRRLTIRDTEIHTFSGDAFQVDPGRSPAGWGDVLIEGCRFWLEPLREPENGFARGVIPGENAIDTKASAGAPRATLTVRDVVAFGFRDGLIGNMAAFNFKEHVEVLVDGATVFDSEIAFRLRGPRFDGARVRVQNAVIHSADVAFRYEDDLPPPAIYNVTVGRNVRRPFVSALSSKTVLDVRNFLMLGRAVPRRAAAPSNRALAATAFVDADAHDYRLRSQSPAVDGGEPLAAVTHDRAGTARPQGLAYDIGAYEQPRVPDRQAWSAGRETWPPGTKVAPRADFRTVLRDAEWLFFSRKCLKNRRSLAGGKIAARPSAAGASPRSGRARRVRRHRDRGR